MKILLFFCCLLFYDIRIDEKKKPRHQASINARILFMRKSFIQQTKIHKENQLYFFMSIHRTFTVRVLFFVPCSGCTELLGLLLLLFVFMDARASHSRYGIDAREIDSSTRYALVIQATFTLIVNSDILFMRDIFDVQICPKRKRKYDRHLLCVFFFGFAPVEIEF